MYQKVKAYMKEHGMVVDGDVVLAGVVRYMCIMESAARKLTGMKE